MQQLHNAMEDIVQKRIDAVYAEMAKDPQNEGLCMCEQCKLDAACFVLNRVKPRYMLSSRGVVREEQLTLDKQQTRADVDNLVLQAMKIVGHNRRNAKNHTDGSENAATKNQAVFNIPIIIGRLFNGQNFEPMEDINVELYHEGKLLQMKNSNWRNPFHLSPETLGTYTFWAEAVAAKAAGEHRVFDFLLRAQAAGFEALTHHFEVPATSEEASIGTFSIEDKFKVIDLYFFHPEPEK
jgi:competence protein ComFB